MPSSVPSEVEAVFSNFLTCEFTTLGNGDAAVTWPILPTFWPERGLFVIASPAALSQKAVNVRRNARVSLLYSNPTGSGLERPPAVLVQGEARSPDEVVTNLRRMEPGLVACMTEQGRRLMRSQPGMRMYLANGLTRALMEWYFIRVFIFVTPVRLTWWPGGDFAVTPQRLEVAHVGAD